MQRVHQLVFCLSLVGLSWLAMMGVHELGHVVGALVTGGNVERVVLHPLTVSRTDVAPNPHPAVVVWMGPLVGSLLPLLLFAAVPGRFTVTRKVAQFFAGFCLIANGAYIAVGGLVRIGDAGEMLRTGTPLAVMLTFGAVTILPGLHLWHRLGSPRQFIADPPIVTPRMAYVTLAALVVVIVVEVALSPR